MRWIEYCECKQPWHVGSATRVRHYLYTRLAAADAARWAVRITDEFFDKGTAVQPEFEQSLIVTTTKRKRK
jgi:hypothetical protein